MQQHSKVRAKSEGFYQGQRVEGPVETVTSFVGSTWSTASFPEQQEPSGSSPGKNRWTSQGLSVRMSCVHRSFEASVSMLH